MGKSFKTHSQQVNLVRKKSRSKLAKQEAKAAELYLRELEEEANGLSEGQDREEKGEVPAPTTSGKVAEEVLACPVSHRVVVVPLEDKRTALSKILQDMHNRESMTRQKSKVVIFTNEFATAKSLLPTLSTKRTVVAHTRGKGRLTEVKGVGLLRSEDSEETVSSFKSGKYQTLITNDSDSAVLWDTRNAITTVINYDFPKHLGIYTNRASLIGATAPKGQERTCEVVSVFTPSQANVAQAPHLVKYLRQQNQEVPETLQEIASLVGEPDE